MNSEKFIKQLGCRALLKLPYRKQRVFKVKNPAQWLGSVVSYGITPTMGKE